MFDRWHYVPVLRWKVGERTALARLPEDARRPVTPLIELPLSQLLGKRRKRPRSPQQYLEEMAADFVGMWGSNPVFVDFAFVADYRLANHQHALTVLGDTASSRGAHVIPVTGLGRPLEYQRAVRQLVSNESQGVAIRLFLQDMEDGLGSRLDELLSTVGADAQATDLLIDCSVLAGLVQNYKELLRGIPSIREWRSLTLIAGAFPKDLSGYMPGEHRLKRIDWSSWRDQFADNGSSVVRAPAYGDYATLHATFEEPPRGANPSASIRYATDEDWLIMRGESLRKPGGPGPAQWIAEAQLLCEKHEYQGPDYCWGDRFIYEKAEATNGPGSTTQWLAATVNHHLTLVARQISNLREA
jgi:hypothetical protein